MKGNHQLAFPGPDTIYARIEGPPEAANAGLLLK